MAIKSGAGPWGLTRLQLDYSGGTEKMNKKNT